MPNGVPEPNTTPQVILDQARRQGDQQDAILDAHKRQAVLIAGAYLSTGTITIAAMTPAIAASTTVDSALTIRAAVVVLAWSLATSLIAARVQWLAQRWQGAVPIQYLIENYSSLRGRRRILELDLAATLETHYLRNKEQLHSIKRWLLVQALVAFIGVGVLIMTLLSLT